MILSVFSFGTVAAHCSIELTASSLLLANFYSMLLPACLYVSALTVENNAAGFIAFLILTLLTVAGVFGL